MSYFLGHICLKRPSLICLFHFTKRYVSISTLSLFLSFLSLSLSVSVSLLLSLLSIFLSCVSNEVFVLVNTINFPSRNMDPLSKLWQVRISDSIYISFRIGYSINRVKEMGIIFLKVSSISAGLGEREGINITKTLIPTFNTCFLNLNGYCLLKDRF